MDEPSASVAPRPGRSSRGRRLLIALFCLCAVALVVRATNKKRGVLLNNQAFGERFLAGQDPYFDPSKGHRVHGPYPPSFVLVAAPLSLLPPKPARALWATAQVLALVLVYRLLRGRTRRVWPGGEARGLVWYGLALLLVSRFLLRDTAAGGGNLLFMSLALAGLELAWRGRPLACGVVTGLGLALKPNLAPLLLFYVARGRWRPVLASALAFLAWFALPAAWVGAGPYSQWARDWGSSVVAYARLDDLRDLERLPDGMPAPESAMNQSLREALFRLTRPPGPSGAADVRITTLPVAVTAWTTRAIAALLVLAVFLAARRAREGLEEWLAALTFLPLSLLLSPITWKAHHVVLLPLFYVLVAACALRPRPAVWLPWFLGVYYVVCDLANTELLGDRAGDLLQAWSVVTWMDLALIAVGVGFVLGRRLAPRAEEALHSGAAR